MIRSTKKNGSVGNLDTITLYRGLGLPEDAIQTYRDLLKSQIIFSFTAFTSTSAEKRVAIEFAFISKKTYTGHPVLFVLEVIYYNG